MCKVFETDSRVLIKKVYIPEEFLVVDIHEGIVKWFRCIVLHVKS